MLKVKPDLLTFADGSCVDEKSWRTRRAELASILVPHEYGGMPPLPLKTEAILRSRSTVRDLPQVMFHVYDVRVSLPQNKEINFTMHLWVPQSDKPQPVVLDGDGCWRYLHNPVVVRSIVERGNIVAQIDRTEAAADNPPLYRNTGLYRLYPDAKFAVLSCWAWALHRAVDALLLLPIVRTDAIAITGHSRGGKTVLLAGATDERIALTNPNCSGIGGAGLHRVKMADSEVIDSFFQSQNIVWFGEGLREFRNRDHELFYDQHFLHAMVAPRLLLVTEAYEDPWANPAGTYAACNAAREVYSMLGHPEAIGWTVREGDHAHYPQDYLTLLDFMDRHFHRRTVNREFQRTLYPDLDKLLR